MKKRIVIAGFGDTGMLLAIHLGPTFDIVGISPKPCLVSGQELGMRLSRPQHWRQNYLMPFSRYKKLDGVTTLQGLISHIDTDKASVTVQQADGSETELGYDVLVIASGVSNGFWRRNLIESLECIEAGIETASRQLAQATSVAIIGGGATGVSVAANLALQYPQKAVKLFFSHALPLPNYHPRVRQSLQLQLDAAGVISHPNHRAVIAPGTACDQLTTDLIRWSSGQSPFQPELALWAVGAMHPNNQFIPPDMLNDDGFVLADATLRVPGYNNVFTVGDIAATDPHRSSARNWGYRLLANNIRACLAGKSGAIKNYQAPAYRWGSILGPQHDGLRIFQPNGGNFRFPRWSVDTLLFPLAVHRMIYKGVRQGPG